MKIRPQLLDMRPGTRIVSNTFLIGDADDAWSPDATQPATEGCQTWCLAHLWIVPARVEGTWTLDGQPLVLSQHLQTVTGTLGGVALSDTFLRGAELTFTIGGRTYTGHVSDDGRTIAGDGWRASRSYRPDVDRKDSIR